MSMISSIIWSSGPEVEPQGQRNRRRLWNICREELEKDIKRTGHTWKQLVKIALDREKWKKKILTYAPEGVTAQNK